MNINNLKEGMILKSYRDLCKVMDWKIAGGDSKNAQLKELDMCCDYEKQGNKFIINKIFDTPKEKTDKRSNNKGNYKEYKELNIKQSEWNNIGVYYILKDNDIYIGSTIQAFKTRFQTHYYGYDELMKHTYELLQNGGIFNILYDMTGIEDEVLIRQVEDKYIQYFIDNSDYNVVNKKEKAYSVTERIRPLKNKMIKVREDKYEQAIQLLIDNGLLDLEEKETPTNNYILNGIIDNFDINNMPF